MGRCGEAKRDGGNLLPPVSSANRSKDRKKGLRLVGRGGWGVETSQLETLGVGHMQAKKKSRTGQSKTNWDERGRPEIWARGKDRMEESFCSKNQCLIRRAAEMNR